MESGLDGNNGPFAPRIVVEVISSGKGPVIVPHLVMEAEIVWGNHLKSWIAIMYSVSFRIIQCFNKTQLSSSILPGDLR